jgi:hypothetical protein
VTNSDSPIIFLVGPPGSGKSVLGRRASTELGLRFVDLVDDERTDARLEELVRLRSADLVALPWAPTRDRTWLRLCRRSGATVALWAHPLEMQARSGRLESMFTPSKRLTTEGGFGRRGTGCSEYRHLARACEYVVDLIGLSVDDAAQTLKEVVQDLRTTDLSTPAEREGLLGWRDDWRADFNADPKACELLVDAMARFMLHLKAGGSSPRALAQVRRELNAAGFLVMCCDAPQGRSVLRSIAAGPNQYEYRRKFTDSPAAWERFSSTWAAFAAFLREPEGRT